jgi:hypothetical protein
MSRLDGPSETLRTQWPSRVIHLGRAGSQSDQGCDLGGDMGSECIEQGGRGFTRLVRRGETPDGRGIALSSASGGLGGITQVRRN